MTQLDRISSKKRLVAAISVITASTISGLQPVIAAESAEPVLEELIVTANRRSKSVMDIPINVLAIGGDEIVQQRLYGLDEISRYVPGLQITDNGPRDDSPNIMVRGLNTDALGPAFNSDLVATYLGDIPVEIDLKPNDLERVEVLIGPQGTLYGAATMGGAIRYIPNKADTGSFSLDARGSMGSMAHSDGVSTDFGVTVNLPIIENVLAIRVNVDQLDDEGFIDYTHLVNVAGVSDPNNPSELHDAEDVNGEETLSGRVNLRWTPNETVDANIWYYFQDTEAEGRQINSRAAYGSGRYESALRYEEPNDYDNDLISLDLKVDFGFAEGTLIYGESNYDEVGQRDQTDLLLDFEYGYEFMPSFAAFTREVVDEESETWEVRLVSQYDSKFSWIVGYYDYEFESSAISEEFAPGFDQFAVDEFGGVQLRPDALEYIQLTDQNESETAFYGEISYQFNDKFLVTVGYRDYEFDVDSTGGFGLPLFDTVFLGEPQDAINVDLGTNQANDTGDLFKFNVSWTPDLDTLVYFTYSEGYRNGGVNSVPECTPEQIASDTQQLCALSDEVLIKSDEIENIEIGVKATLLNGRLSANAAVYTIDWDDLQVSDVTVNGDLPITGNGSSAESRGLELSLRWLINANWDASLTYAYIDAELTAPAPGLVGPLDAPDGTRLPGSPEHQSTFNITYHDVVWGNVNMLVNYGFSYTGEIMNLPGGDEEPALAARVGENIDSYTLHHLSATFARDQWSVQLFADNLTDEYYVAGTRSTRRLLQENRGLINGRALRSYGEYVGLPRNIGLSLTYSF